VKYCPRCNRGCQNKYERLCGACATEEYKRQVGPESFATERAKHLLRLDPFAFAAEFADQAEQ
jgi:NMD protein affecting ribosome stability and mRNA decay